ncbi:MAG: histidine phosphatase family protein, partial [Armatimonadota bacterium]|nr:histidine phosphatase family protein [Armatimonadota bacterium]
MQLYLLRHGAAADADPARGLTDALRPLTDAGRRGVESIAVALRGAGVRPEVVFSSPCIRAVQTAEIVARVLQLSGDPVIRKPLAPGCRL